MDALHFDAATRRLGALAGRRAAVRAILVGLLTGRVLAAWEEAAAKKKKKKKKKKCKAPNTKCGKKGCCQPGQPCRNGACQGPCIFTETPNLWTLQRDCIAQSPITVPAGTTLDGAGHTIFLLGTTQTLTYGVGAQGGEVNIENLTVDGAGLTCNGPCGAQRGVAIQYGDASGSISDTTIVGLAPSSGFGISVIVGGNASPERTVNIDNVAISGALEGIFASGINKLTLGVTECDIQDVNFGIQVQYNVEATIEDNEIAATTYGVVITSSASVNAAPDVTATGNSVTGAQIGMSVAAATAPPGPGPGTPTLAATDNTIVGPGSLAAGATHGLQFGKQAAGSADANTISNYFDNGANIGCGIFVAADAGAVSIGTNIFPNPQGSPPGNEQNICDNS
jgi:hypothetical protein